MRYVLTFIFGCAALFVAFLVGAQLREARAVTPSASWSITSHEADELGIVNDGYQHLADDLAPVLSDSTTRNNIIRYLAPKVRQLDAVERALVAGARARLGVGADTALVVSGTEWVRR